MVDRALYDLVPALPLQPHLPLFSSSICLQQLRQLLSVLQTQQIHSSPQSLHVLFFVFVMLSPLSIDLINWTYLAAINLNLTLKRISLPVPCQIPCRKSSPSCNNIITDVLVFEICLLQDHNCSQGRDYVCHALHNRLRL